MQNRSSRKYDRQRNRIVYQTSTVVERQRTTRLAGFRKIVGHDPDLAR